MVAREFAAGDWRDDLFVVTPGLSVLRYAVSQAATGQASQGHILMVLDVKSAFSHGETKRAIFLEHRNGDRNVRHPQLVGKLHKALDGTRDTSHQWQEQLITTLKNIGFREVICMPSVFKLGERNVTLLVHVDDIVMMGAENLLQMVQKRWKKFTS